MWGPTGSIWRRTTPKPSTPTLYENPHHTLHTVSESRVLQGKCNIKKWAAKKCNLPSGNLLPGGLCDIPTWRGLLLVEPWASPGHPGVQRAGSGCQGTPQAGRGKQRHLLLLPQGPQVTAHLRMGTSHCATIPTNLVVLSLLWLLFKDPMGPCPWWAIPACASFPWREEERSWGGWRDKPSALHPWSSPTKQRVLVQRKRKAALLPSWGPAPGGSEMLTAYTLASVFLISVFTNLTHTHTHTNAIFNLQK